MKTIIYGKNVCQSYAKRFPKLIQKIWVTEKGFTKELLAILKPLRLNDKEMENMLGKVRHQGIAMQVQTPGSPSLKQFLETEKDKEVSGLLVLDHIQDPGNFGALYRSAAGLGMAAIIVPNSNHAAMSGSFFQSTAGTFGLVPIIQVSNINQTVDLLKKGRYIVVGADATSSAVPIKSGMFDARTAMVLGGEHKGLSALTSTKCDQTVKIPLQTEVESYNVSVAGAILMYEWVRQFQD